MPLFTRTELHRVAKEVDVKDQARVPIESGENAAELNNAMEAIKLAREALYDLEWVYIPEGDATEIDDKLKLLEIRLNFAKEAAALLPQALSVMSKYISTGE